MKTLKQKQNTHSSTQYIIYIMKYMGVSTNRNVHSSAVHIENHKKEGNIRQE